MFFSNHNRSNVTLYNQNNNNNNNNNVNNTIMPFSRKYQIFKMKQDEIMKQNQNNKIEPKEIIQNATVVEKKGPGIWGNHIWTLFHTLAEKISPESFLIVGNDLIDIVIKICGNLPCPTCSEHALYYISKNKFNTTYITSKEQFRLALFNFHNYVNNEKRYQQFSIDELSGRYANLNTISVIQNFMTVFKDKHFSINMISNDFHRNRIVTQLTQWFKENIRLFI